MRKIDTNSWIRKEHFEFFSGFDEPFFGVVSEADCTKAMSISKTNNISFFAWYLHAAMVAVNAIEEFKTRVEGNDVVLHEIIHASSTIGRENGTFGFSFVPYTDDFFKFSRALKAETEEVRATTGLRLTDNATRQDLIHLSSLPWYKVYGISHPRNFGNRDSVPKITFGRYSACGDKLLMPVSICMHHGLADGKHVADFLELFQQLLNRNI